MTRAARFRSRDGAARWRTAALVVVAAALLGPMTPTSEVSNAARSAVLAPAAVGAAAPPGELLAATAAPVRASEPSLPISMPAVADGTDWSTFRADPQRDSAAHHESTLAPSNISALGPAWVFSSGYAVEGSPTVVNGRVYFGAWNGYEYALNASNGTMLWRTYLGVTTGTCTYAPEVGVTSSAAVVNGTLLVGGGNSYWYALNASTGAVLGRVYVGANGASGGNYNWASPLVVGGYAYIGIASECDSPLVRGGLLMVNISDPAAISNASIVHAFYTEPSGDTGNSIWASPSYDPVTNSVFVATGNPGSYTGPYAQAVIALNATDLAVRSSWQVLQTPNGDSDFSAGPMVYYDPNGTPQVVAVNKDGLDYAFNASTIASGPIWERAVSEPRNGYGPPAFNGSTLFLSGGAVTVGGVEHAGSVVAVTPGNATLWTHYTPGFVEGGATYADGLVFVASYTENVGSDGTFVNSTVEVLSSANGSVLDTIAFPEEAVNSTLTVSDGRLYVGFANQTLTDGGGVAAFGLPLGVNATATALGNASVQFDAEVSGGSPDYTFQWAFGDGNASTSPDPLHQYAAAGRYPVTLGVRDANGELVQWSTNVSVAGTVTPLTATLAVVPDAGIAPLTTEATTAPQGGTPPYSVNWTFGDGTSARGPTSEPHFYPVPGVYQLLAVIRDAAGAVVTVQQNITVAAPLSATIAASPTRGADPLAVNLTAAVDGGFGPYSFTWNFGDGSPDAVEQNTSHLYTGPGNYTATLSVLDRAGDNTTATTSVIVVPPTLVVTVSGIGVASCGGRGGAAVFTAMVSGGLPPYSYAWSFGDGNTSTAGPQVVTRYPAEYPGNATLTVRDAAGDEANASAPVGWATTSCPPPAATTTPGEWNGLEVVALVVGVAIAAVVAGLVVFRRRARPPPRPPGDGPEPRTPT